MHRYVLFLFTALMLGGCASYVATSGRVVIRDDTGGMADVRIDDRDRTQIRQYYEASGRHRQDLPPGLAKREGNLPPGLAKRDRLPPGLQGEPLPRDLERRLSPIPSAYVRVRIGQDVVLMDRRTRVVLDVIYGVGD